MSDPLLHPEQVEPPSGPGPSRRWLKFMVYIVALVMLGLCIWIAITRAQGEGDVSGWHRLAQADMRYVAIMLGLVAMSIAINGIVFRLAVLPFENKDKPISTVDMTMLIAATSLLNYLPMRAGMIGRAAYLKQQHDIGYWVSAVMMIIVAGGTMGVYVLLSAATFWRGQLDSLWWTTVVGGLILGTVLCIPTLRLGLRIMQRSVVWLSSVDLNWFDQIGRRGLIWSAILLSLRGVDVMCTAGRLWLAAQIFGAPIEAPTAIVMACAGMFVTLATPLPNGLGLREGLYGLMASVGVGDGATGLAIGLIDRAVEAIVFIVMGLVAVACLHKKKLSNP